MTGNEADVSGSEDADDLTMFVGGCDRSGTTLVSRLLAEQLGLLMLPEAYFHAVAFRRFGPDVSAAVALRHWRRRSWSLQADDPRGDTRLGPFLHDCMGDIHASRRGVRSPTRVVESTPENIEIGSILLDEFPAAHLVHVIRDPRAVAASLRAADFGPRTVQECARVWKQRIASGLGLEAHRPDRVTRVRYEDLVAAPEALPPSLAALAGRSAFSWDAERDAMLDPTSHKFQAGALGPVNAERIDSWRCVLTPAEIGAVEFECRELMLAFGYDVDGLSDERTSTQRLLSAARSNIGELTTGSARRFLRVTRARLRYR